jgi:DNA-binding GntR family transcriptional regulator
MSSTHTHEISGNGALPDSTLAAQAYVMLRQRIVSGAYPPGMRLTERNLAEELGFSRVPLREALPQLEADGFITTSIRRGATVTQLTMRDIVELFDVRIGIEVHAAKLAAQHARMGGSTDPLAKVMSRADEVLLGGDSNEITSTNAQLHEEIVRLSNNSLLSAMMRPLVGRMRWVFTMTSDRDPTVQCREHHELVDAIRAGDHDLAASLAYAHVERGRQPTIAALQAFLPAG